jgi:VWFA-related protein
VNRRDFTHLFPLLPALAQQPLNTDQTITVDVQRVAMVLAVTDRRGRFVTDLVKEDFEVLENKKPQEIVQFSAETDLPLRLAIVIDTSNSIRDRFRFEQEAATTFIRNVIRPDVDRALVIGFDTATELVADLTGDIGKLEEAVAKLRAGGGTAMYDAIFFASRDKLLMDQPREKFRRAMVVLSDGDDNQSRSSRDQALEWAQRADVTVYTISTNISRIQTDGDKVLKYFAAETGGQAFFPFKATDLEQSFENIANELRKQYSMLYKPEPYIADGLFHPVTIRVNGRKDLVVRCRRGYYARRNS